MFEEIVHRSQKAAIAPLLIDFALGVHGNTQKLPAPGILDFVTMCGHGLVSGNLVKKMVRDLKKKKITLEKAAIELAKPCLCGIFNPDRASKLLKKMLG